MKIFMLALPLLMLSGCYLNDEHYEGVITLPSQIESLKQTDRELKQEIESLKDAMSRLKSGMHTEISEQTVSIKQVAPTSIQVSLQQHLLFTAGSSSISQKGRQVLAKFADAIRAAPATTRIRIVGHTDALPMGEKLRQRYTDNWELSAIRAATVARYFVWGEKIDTGRLHIEGSSDTQPVADNDSEEGRAQNRRIELYLESI